MEDARELREIEEEKTDYRKKTQAGSGDLFSDQPARQRRLYKDDGTPIQMNTAKWPFSIEDDGTNVRVDVALPKFLDSAQARARPEPSSPAGVRVHWGGPPGKDESQRSPTDHRS